MSELRKLTDRWCLDASSCCWR